MINFATFKKYVSDLENICEILSMIDDIRVLKKYKVSIIRLESSDEIL